MNKITLSDNFFIIVKNHERRLIACLFEGKVVKLTKVFPVTTEREEIQKWGMKYIS